MVSTEWAAPGQGQRTVNLGGTAGYVNVSRPNVDGSFVFLNVIACTVRRHVCETRRGEAISTQHKIASSLRSSQ
jgi:hypothetical protein